MTWEITKEFDFCYSHRVWNQELRKELALDCNLGCTAQHGHNGKVLISCHSNKLDHKGMVIDFKELSFMKKFIDDKLDHKCILDIHDPSIPIFYPLVHDDSLIFHSIENYYTIHEELYRNLSKPEIEIYRGMVFVPFVPTSENLSKWLFEIVQKKLDGIATVSKVEFYETPKSKSIYSR